MKVQLVLESQKKPTASLLSAPLSGENTINSWVRATEALRAEDGSSHLVWQSSVAAVCPAGYTMFKEKNLYSLARSSHKLPNKGFLVGDGFPEGRGSQRGLLWTFVPPFQHLISTDITSNPVWNGNVLLDLTARSQYLIGLQATQQPAEDILENICHSNVRGIVSHIEFFWSQSCSDWFQPPPQSTPPPSSSLSSSSCSTAATTLRMSALMCGAMLQSLIIVFRDHADLLDEVENEILYLSIFNIIVITLHKVSCADFYSLRTFLLENTLSNCGSLSTCTIFQPISERCCRCGKRGEQ